MPQAVKRYVQVKLVGGPYDGGDAAVEQPEPPALKTRALIPLVNDKAHVHAVYHLIGYESKDGAAIPVYCFEGRE